ncbi:TPA: phage tail protein [Klebsiella aerogenes]|nr:phage tail protein [Klebsiella aerogenes]
MNSYTTIQGDAWDLIARKVYGDEYLAGYLMAANIKHRNTVLFSGNVVLNVPDAPEVLATANNLPPWRRNSVT